MTYDKLSHLEKEIKPIKLFGFKLEEQIAIKLFDNSGDFLPIFGDKYTDKDIIQINEEIKKRTGVKQESWIPKNLTELQ